METNQTLQTVLTAIEDMKGQQVEDYDVSALTPMADHMVIATGSSTTHIKAMADEVAVKIKEAGGQVKGVEGRGQAELQHQSVLERNYCRYQQGS